MKYWISLALLPVEECVELAKHCDQLGLEGVTLPEHTVLPETITTPYPGHPTGAFTVPKDAQFPSTWVAIAAMAAVTERLRFATTVSVLPMRNPLVLAKDVATAACIAPGRVALGAGVGWMEEEFAALGYAFDGRGRRADAMISILRAAWRQGWVEYDGDGFRIPKVHLHPRPPADVPIWVGGKGTAALRRAAVLGDGWISEGYFDVIGPLIGKLQELRDAHGTTGRPFEIVISTVGRANGPWPDGGDVERLAALGVAGIKVQPWSGGGQSLDDKKRALDRFAQTYL